MMNSGRLDELSVDADQSEKLVKLLDAVVIKLEGGTDLDLQVLDVPPPTAAAAAAAAAGTETKVFTIHDVYWSQFWDKLILHYSDFCYSFLVWFFSSTPHFLIKIFIGNRVQ